MDHIWKPLTYDAILNTVEKTLQRPLSNLCLRRNSYINRVFELEQLSSKERFIVKFYRPGRWTPKMIQEEHDFVKELATQEIPVIPPLMFDDRTLFFLEKIPFAVFPKKGGRTLDEFNKEGWTQLGRLLARMHLVGAEHTSAHRLLWRPAVATRQHLDVLLNANYLPPDYQQVFRDMAEKFIKLSDPLFSKEENILLHGDCHKGNLIFRPGEGIYLVDFDDICMGPPVQDLWMLLPGKTHEAEQEIIWFLEGYRTFRDLRDTSLQLIPALRGMRLIHFCAWCAVQSTEPGFAEHFPEWGTLKYWNVLIKDLQQLINEELFYC
jgi:Ser/Thr protein kinase RdoA (MazF antagonist)